MIVKKKWVQTSRFGTVEWEKEGWYLFGLIPLYVRDLRPRGRFK